MILSRAKENFQNVVNSTWRSVCLRNASTPVSQWDEVRKTVPGCLIHQVIGRAAGYIAHMMTLRVVHVLGMELLAEP